MKKTKIWALAITILACAGTTNAQKNYWQKIEKNQVPAGVLKENKINVKSGTSVKLDYDYLKTLVAKAPAESADAAHSKSFTIQIPMPDNRITTFRVWESTLMSPALKASFPGIKAYCGYGVTDPGAVFCADFGPNGFHAMIISESGSVFIDPYSRKDNRFYQVYYKKDFDPGTNTRFNCSSHPAGDESSFISSPSRSTLRANGAQLRTFNLAISATGEYGAYFGSKANAAAQIVTTVGRVNEIYKRDLSISLVLVDNSDIIFTNPNGDPFTDGTDIDQIIDENTGVINGSIGADSYDIGHAFSASGGNGAAMKGVCNNALKAQACTMKANPVGDPFDIDYVAHEMGHQFNADHTFNDCYAGNQRVQAFAFEPGSGVTIMGYAGICDAGKDIAAHSDAMFHNGSYDQILDYVINGAGAGCAVVTNTGNTAPNVNAGNGGFSIPRGTAFTLTGNGNDINNDPVTYSWEQMNTTNQQRINNSTSTSGPNFRTFLPTASPSRTFPNINNVVANNLTDWREVIYNGNSDRVFNFRIVARDGKGGVDYSPLQFTVRTGAGPFTVTAPNTAVNWAAGSQQTVNWNVNNTNAAPINAANVRITLSTDGGFTYPVTILASTPNDGSQVITVPNNITNTARIRVEYVGANYSFFDISNVNFTISQGNGGVNYCASQGNSTAYERIDRVQLGTINNTGGSNTGYSDFTAISTNLTRGVSTNITLTPGFPGGGSYSEGWNVYIDYNRDGDFADAGEMVASGLSSAAITKAITPPAATSAGSTRMRVIMQYNAQRNDPCGSFAEGEVEDYTVNIVAAAPVASAAIADGVNKNTITVSPNPAEDIITVESAAGTLINTIKIVDFSGRTVLSKSVNSGKSLINISRLSAGTYFVSAKLANGDEQMIRIIKK